MMDEQHDDGYERSGWVPDPEFPADPYTLTWDVVAEAYAPLASLTETRRMLLADAPDTDPLVLCALTLDPSRRVRLRLVARPDLPIGAVVTLVTDADADVALVARRRLEYRRRNPATASLMAAAVQCVWGATTSLEYEYEHPDWWPATVAFEEWYEAVRWGSEERAATAANPTCPVEILELLADCWGHERDVAVALAANPSVPARIRAVLALAK